ncbi:sce7726 family protein [Grimontia hollisae]|uniref:sce7726 family protein n=1 Tax=Grimontia hollisae TaxID=673 RepID=UPI00165E79B5|nr:sce7726 family protein [Grimontia hollisae]
MQAQKLLESDIKARLINHLYKKGRINSDSVVISELTISDFSRRVDLVVANQNGLTAYEVKSASDNLSRLTGQVDDYLRHFDKVIVVADTKHIKSTLQITPHNVGVIEISGDNFIVRRRGTKTRVSKKTPLISFLTTSEISKLLPANLKLSNRVSKRNEALKATSVKRLRAEVYNFLRRKFASTSNQLLEKLDSGIDISALDIEDLSIYIPERRLREEKKAQKSQLWSSWASELSLTA